MPRTWYTADLHFGHECIFAFARAMRSVSRDISGKPLGS